MGDAREGTKSKNYEVFTLGMLLSGGKIPRPEGKRSVPMKVLCLGYSRTGTVSLKKALTRLGYGPTYHMLEYATHRAHDVFWRRVLPTRYTPSAANPPLTRADWDSSPLAHYQSVADAPCIFFASSLISAYPTAKVILTNKSPDAFWRSWSKALIHHQHARPWYVRFLSFFETTLFSSPGHLATMDRYIKQEFQGKHLNEEYMKQKFQDHYDMVRKLVPKERLLEYRIEDGWGPLCEFLGEDVSLLEGEEFPKGNSAEDFVRANDLVWMVESTMTVVKLLGVVVLAYVVLRLAGLR